MIHTGDQPASLYIGTAPVKEAYLGTTKVYPNREPVITVEYSAWTTRSLGLSASGNQIPATGGSISISATAHQTRTKTTLSDGVPIATEQETQSIAVVPVLSSNHASFRVSGTTVSCDHRHAVEGDRLSATITGSYGGASATLTLYQQENKPKSYAYRVVVVSSGMTIAYSGGSTTVLAKSQRAPIYTTEEQGSYADTNEQSISARISGSGFSIAPMTMIDGFDVPFNVSASSHTSTSQRTATVTFTGSIGGSASTTVYQAGMPLTYSFRYTYSDEASKYPRFAVNGVPGVGLLRSPGGGRTPIHMQSYKEAIKKVQGSTTSYLPGEPKLTQVSPMETAYIGAGYDIGWTDSYAMGFIMLQQGNFMNNYPYKYVSSAFTLTGSGFTLSGIAVFEKEYGDLEAAGNKWYVEANPTGILSLAETRAVHMLAAHGSVTEKDVPGMTLEDFETLSAKINAARKPDTNRYELSEDGSWRVIPADEAIEE
ncbi:MAG: hypothetical protein K2G93_04020 [Rikenella sp.]|nr:hypothetical protein [Rikenella sp.]